MGEAAEDMSGTAHSEVGRLRLVMVRHARAAFSSQSAIGSQWRDLGFTAAPDLGRAVREYDDFLDLLNGAGVQLEMLDSGDGLTLDSVYVRDASVVCDRGAILCQMGKAARLSEPAAHGSKYRVLGIPILGSISAPGRLEGGDVVWLNERTLAVGCGYRTNAAGIEQLRALLGDAAIEIFPVSLPHWRGPADVFHLMSIISPVDRDLAVVYSPLMSVSFREQLLARGMTLIEVPDEEFATMGANVLALEPRRCVMVAGNPLTRTRLEAAGVEVLVYKGQEISIKGGGGPTCLTRPLSRNPTQE
jgi:N-dimethylarginine dimethylaminohydrolase